MKPFSKNELYGAGICRNADGLVYGQSDGGGRLSGGAHAAGDYGGIAGFVPAEERGNHLLYGRE